MREIKFRAWDGIRMTLSGVYFDNSRGTVETAAGMPLMQYTDLKDKNGVEIYESDIMRRGSGITEQVGPVVFDRGGFFMEAIGVIPWPNSDSPTGVRFVLAAYESEIEVIGNIYENPELI